MGNGYGGRGDSGGREGGTVGIGRTVGVGRGGGQWGRSKGGGE